jgi:YebC/PmpR family DNA-binding regulatory protein
MSGHSKWATIKRAKAVTDAKRGKAFTKLGKNITVAVQTGGGADPAFNYKLRMAIDLAKAASMPNENIERAIKRGTGEGKAAIATVTYEGYGPAGSALIIEAVTDNTNRTLQTVRQILEKHGGKLGGQGTVAWSFESKGQILVEKQAGADDLPLELIDQGVEDVTETDEGYEIYTLPADLEKIKKFIEAKGIKILNAEAIMRSTQPVELAAGDLEKVQKLVEALEEEDDVVSVHTNTNL